MSDDPLYNNEKPKNKSKRLTDGQLPLLNTPALMEIFNFDDISLRTNEGGFVTNTQKQKIVDELRGEADSMWLMTTIFLGTSLVLAMIFSLQGYAPLPLVIGAGIVIGLLLLVAYRRQAGLRADTARLRTYRVEGIPKLAFSMTGDSQTQLIIGKETLPITYQQAQALGEFSALPIRVYYAANSKQVLSAEVLADNEALKLKNEDLIEMDDYEVYDERQLDERDLTMKK